MFTKIKHYQQKIAGLSEQVRDVRMLGLGLFLVIVLLISWSGVKIIDTNYELQKQISELRQQNEVKRLANENLKLQNQYLETNQYLDVAARQNFGLAAPGETVLSVPKEVALSYTIDLPNTEQAETATVKKKQPAYQRNFQDWMDFFLHRKNDEQ